MSYIRQRSFMKNQDETSLSLRCIYKKSVVREAMKIRYDKQADVAYIQLSSKKPDGGVEISEGVVLHTTKKTRSSELKYLIPAKGSR